MLTVEPRFERVPGKTKISVWRRHHPAWGRWHGIKFIVISLSLPGPQKPRGKRIGPFEFRKSSAVGSLRRIA